LLRSSHPCPRLHWSSATHRPMAGLSKMRCMDEQVTHRLRRSSMGHSKVVVRWPVISMASSLGSTNNGDVGCHFIAMIACVDVA